MVVNSGENMKIRLIMMKLKEHELKVLPEMIVDL